MAFSTTGVDTIKIEHRLWSAVTSNWRGRPLTSHEVVVNLIGATTNSNKKGLKVQAHLDTGSYPTGVKITNAELAAVPLASPSTTFMAAGTTPCTPGGDAIAVVGRASGLGERSRRSTLSSAQATGLAWT